MLIETKFNVGDDCYMMQDNKIVKKTIYGIRINVNEERVDTKTFIEYHISKAPFGNWHYEHQLFSSVEELLEHLKEELK